MCSHVGPGVTLLLSGVGEGVLCSHVGVLEGTGVGKGEGAPVGGFVGFVDGGLVAGTVGGRVGDDDLIGVGTPVGTLDKVGAKVKTVGTWDMDGGEDGSGVGPALSLGPVITDGKVGTWLTDGEGVGRQEISVVGSKVVPTGVGKCVPSIGVGACVSQPLEPLEPLPPLVPFDPLEPLQPFDPFDPFDPLEP